MAFDLITIKCPECNGVLSVEAGKKNVHCSYCGAKILLYDDNEYTYHYVDEAEVENAKVKKQIREKEIELELRKIDFLEKKRTRIDITILVLMAISFLLIVGGALAGDYSSDPNNSFYVFACFGVFLFIAVFIFAVLYAFVTNIIDRKMKK